MLEILFRSDEKKVCCCFSLKIFYFDIIDTNGVINIFLLTMTICLFHNSFINLHKSLWDKLMYTPHNLLQFISEYIRLVQNNVLNLEESGIIIMCFIGICFLKI